MEQYLPKNKTPPALKSRFNRISSISMTLQADRGHQSEQLNPGHFTCFSHLKKLQKSCFVITLKKFSKQNMKVDCAKKINLQKK